MYNLLPFSYLISRQTHNSSKSPHFGAISIQCPQTQHIGLYSIYYHYLTVHLNEPNKTHYNNSLALHHLSPWVEWDSEQVVLLYSLQASESSFVSHTWMWISQSARVEQSSAQSQSEQLIVIWISNAVIWEICDYVKEKIKRSDRVVCDVLLINK